MTDRVDLLEERVTALSEALAGLEARLAAVESGSAAAPSSRKAGDEPEVAEGSAATEGLAVPDVSSPAAAILAGVAFLGLGGGYFIRALTEAGALPHLGGALLGLAYALAWIVAADRSGRLGRTAEATLHGVLSLAIALPLLWESTVRLQALPPVAAAGLLASIGVAVFVVAWRHDLAGLAWTDTLGVLGTAWGLLLATTRIELFTILLIAFGAGTLWSTYGRRWHALRWPAAIAADLAVLALVFLGSRPGGPPEAWAGFRPGRAAFVALLLFVVYAGSFAARTLARQRGVNVFEAVQMAAVLVAGYLGAVRLAQAAGTGETALGVAALVLSALAYAAAFGFVSRDSAGARNFLFFSSIALLLALTGGSLLAAGSTLALVWGAFGIAAAALGARFDRRSLDVHGAVYIVAAGVPSGLFAAATAAFTRATDGNPIEVGVPAAVIALGAAFSFVLIVRFRGGRATSASAHVAPVALLAVAAAGAGAVAVESALRFLPAGAAPSVRTAVLAVAAVVLAALRARSGVVEAGWFAWSILGVAALKLFVQDFPGGRPATLFTAFVVYGLALMAVSRLMRRRPTRT